MTPQPAFWLTASPSHFTERCAREQPRMRSEFNKYRLSHQILTVEKSPLPVNRKLANQEAA